MTTQIEPLNPLEGEIDIHQEKLKEIYRVINQSNLDGLEREAVAGEFSGLENYVTGPIEGEVVEVKRPEDDE